MPLLTQKISYFTYIDHILTLTTSIKRYIEHYYAFLEKCKKHEEGIVENLPVGARFICLGIQLDLSRGFRVDL